jgi:hypothetical protein
MDDFRKAKFIPDTISSTVAKSTNSDSIKQKYATSTHNSNTPTEMRIGVPLSSLGLRTFNVNFMLFEVSGVLCGAPSFPSSSRFGMKEAKKE